MYIYIYIYIYVYMSATHFNLVAVFVIGWREVYRGCGKGGGERYVRYGAHDYTLHVDSFTTDLDYNTSALRFCASTLRPLRMRSNRNDSKVPCDTRRQKDFNNLFKLSS